MKDIEAIIEDKKRERGFVSKPQENATSKAEVNEPTSISTTKEGIVPEGSISQLTLHVKKIMMSRQEILGHLKFSLMNLIPIPHERKR